MEKKAPEDCKHKPIVSVADYDQMDGPYAGQTDVCALSLGWAQYNNEDISMKVWRHTGKRWSRQSEELPIHRNLDLTILFLDILFGNPINPDSFLTKGKHQVTEDQDGGINTIRQYYEDNKDILKPRLKEIKYLLEGLK